MFTPRSYGAPIGTLGGPGGPRTGRSTGSYDSERTLKHALSRTANPGWIGLIVWRRHCAGSGISKKLTMRMKRPAGSISPKSIPCNRSVPSGITIDQL